MAQYFKFYKALFTPTGLATTVGGGISNDILLPRLNTLFCNATVSDSIDTTQYRKFFIKQIYDVTFTGVTLQMVNVEHSGYISFGTGTSGSSTASSTVAPAGVTFSGNYTGNVTLDGVTTSGSIIPVWIKQTIPAGAGDDDFVAFQLRVLGTIV